MPVVMEKSIPSALELKEEGLPIYLGGNKPSTSDKAIKVVIVNLMPNKEETEKQILRQLVNTSLLLEIKFMRLNTHQSKNSTPGYLERYYESFDQLKKERIDGMIITGAPLEKVDFEAVDYWEELKKIMDYSKENISSTLFICWGAIAGLYHFYNVPKSLVDKKVFGVFPHLLNKPAELFNHFQESFWVPESRYFQLDKSIVEKVEDIDIISESSETGIYAVQSKDKKQVFVTGHLEYCGDTLKKEYLRDINKGLEIDKPRHYFPNDDSSRPPKYHWRKNANRFFNNWLKYYVQKI